MSKALIQVTNPSTQEVAENSIINLGTVLRRFGCGCRLSGNGIEITTREGQIGYFAITGAVTVEPTAAGAVSIAVYSNGVQLPGTLVSGTAAAAGDPVTLPIVTTVRQNCCDGADNLTVMLLAGAGNVTNLSLRVVKE